jgi:DNA polymerase elongation subunit (family B)
MVFDVCPDVRTAYNQWGFDDKFCSKRAEHTHARRYWYQSHLVLEQTPLEELKLSSDALGDNVFLGHRLTGTLIIDMLFFIQQQFKPKYAVKLKNVVADFLPNHAGKIDLTPEEQFVIFETATLEAYEPYIEYCDRDAVLPIELMFAPRIVYLPNLLALSRVSRTPIQDIVLRGQQEKSYNLLLYVANSLGDAHTRGGSPLFVWNRRTLPSRDYDGAVVIPPHRGFHRRPVTTLDFNRLYPSIMEENLLCPSNYVLEEDVDKYRGAKNNGYKEFEICDAALKPVRTHVFVQRQDGIVPKIINYLHVARLQKKREMKEAGSDVEKRQMLDGAQLALKLTANSLYGFWGVRKNGKSPLLPIAETVTSQGRKMLYTTKSLIEQWYPPVAPHFHPTTVLYGDSVTADTPIPCLIGDGLLYSVVFRSIEEVGDGNWVRRPDGKEECSALPGLRVWSDTGITNVLRVIRHRCGKRIVRVITDSGAVDVTADHSLLTPDGEKISPGEVSAGTPLMHFDLFDVIIPSCKITVDTAFAFGRFFHNGECSDGSDGSKPFISLRGFNRVTMMRALKGFSEYASDVAPAVEFSLHNEYVGVLEISAYWPRMYQDTAVHSQFKHFVRQFSAVMYDQSARKIVPDVVLNGTLDIVQAFFDGYCAGSIQNCNMPVMLNSDSKPGNAGLYYVAKRLGYEISFNVCGNDPTGECVTGAYYMTATKSVCKWVRSAHQSSFVLGVYEVSGVDEDCVVYDLETSSHHFSAGVGRMVVHNTDSVMVMFSEVTDDWAGVEKSFALGTEAARRVTEYFGGGAIVLENEKTYWPFYLKRKKRYMAIKYEAPKRDGGKRDIKGFDTQRRDTVEFVSKVLSNMVSALLEDRSPERAMQVLRDLLQRLSDNKLPLVDYVMSKSLKSAYANPNQVQAVVAAKIEQRNPGKGPRPGSRVDYVVVEGSAKSRSSTSTASTALYLRAEDPDYVAESKGKVRVDRLYYLDSHLRRPVRDLLGALLDPETCNLEEDSADASVARGGPNKAAAGIHNSFPNTDRLIEAAARTLFQQRNNLQDITKMFAASRDRDHDGGGGGRGRITEVKPVTTTTTTTTESTVEPDPVVKKQRTTVAVAVTSPQPNKSVPAGRGQKKTTATAVPPGKRVASFADFKSFVS